MMIDRVIFVCTIVVAAVYLYATTLIPTLEIGDPLGPKAFPRLLGIFLLIGAGLLFIETWRERKAQAPQASGSEASTWRHLGMVAGVTAATAIYYAAFEPLGYIVSTAIYLLALMAWFNRGKWTANVLTAALFSVLSFIMFVKLDVNLPRGTAPFSWVSDAVIAMLNATVNEFNAVRALFQSGGPR